MQECGSQMAAKVSDVLKPVLTGLYTVDKGQLIHSAGYTTRKHKAQKANPP